MTGPNLAYLSQADGETRTPDPFITSDISCPTGSNTVHRLGTNQDSARQRETQSARRNAPRTPLGRTPGPSVYDFAPRLTLAMEQRHNQIVIAADRLRKALRRRDELDKLICHRELQLVRAGATGDARYIKRRSDKLARARAEAERVLRRISRLEAGAA